jgi:hypothetical protein
MSNDLSRAEALEILKLSLDDIERIKQQQWRDTYSLLAVQGGLLGLLLLLTDVTDDFSMRIVFGVVALFAGGLGARLIRNTQITLEDRFRPRRDRALKVLGQDFIALWGETSQSRRYPYTLQAVLCLGTLFAIFLIVKLPPALF